jgi:hypothetical protein
MAVLPDHAGVHQVAECAPPRRAEHESADYHDKSNNKQGCAKTARIDFGSSWMKDRKARPSAKDHARGMREMGIRGLLVYCSYYRCSH